MGNSRKRNRGQKVGPKKRRRYRRIWATLFANSYQNLLSYARKLTNKDEMQAYDAVQEAFLRLWQSVPNPTLITNHGAYMSSIVRNVSHSAKSSVDEVRLDEELESNPDLATEADILKLLELDQSFMRLVSKSKEKRRQDLRRIQLHIEGYSVAEVATILGEKPAHTRYCLSILRSRLKRVIDQDR